MGSVYERCNPRRSGLAPDSVGTTAFLDVTTDTGVVPPPGSGTISLTDNIFITCTFPAGIVFQSTGKDTGHVVVASNGGVVSPTITIATTTSLGTFTVPYTWSDFNSGATGSGSFDIELVWPGAIVLGAQGNAQIAPGNSAAVPITFENWPTGIDDNIQFSFAPPPGFSVPWSAGQMGGILGITLSVDSTVTQGVYTIPYTWTDMSRAASAPGSFVVTVTDQVYPYSLAAPNQVQRALGRLTSVFRNQTNVRGVLTSLLVGVPELTNVFWQIINGRILTNLVLAVA